MQIRNLIQHHPSAFELKPKLLYLRDVPHNRATETGSM